MKSRIDDLGADSSGAIQALQKEMDELIKKFKLEKDKLIADYEEKIKNLSGDSSSAM